MSLNEPLRQQISEFLAQNRVVLFMKGTRQMPQCGFSAQVVKILDELQPSYETVDVLSSPEIRDGIKAFSEWPTIPQLYIDGQFVGGCDIVRAMHASGELQKLIGVQVKESSMQKITMSAVASNEPPQVKPLSAAELESILGRGQIILFDVRPQHERALAAIAGARPLDASGQEYLLGLDRDTPIAFCCHHGIRSQAAAQQMLHEGFRHVYNLKGGIDAWSLTIDASVPRY